MKKVISFVERIVGAREEARLNKQLEEAKERGLRYILDKKNSVTQEYVDDLGELKQKELFALITTQDVFIDGKVIANKGDCVGYADEKSDVQTSTILGAKICESTVTDSLIAGNTQINSSNVQECYVNGSCEINNSTLYQSRLLNKAKASWCQFYFVWAKDEVSFKFCSIHCDRILSVFGLMFRDFHNFAFEGNGEYVDIGGYMDSQAKIGALEQKKKENRALFVAGDNHMLKLVTDRYKFLVDGKPFETTLGDLYNSHMALYRNINDWFAYTQTSGGTSADELIRCNNLSGYVKKLDLYKFEVGYNEKAAFARKCELSEDFENRENEKIVAHGVLANVLPITFENLFSQANVSNCYNRSKKCSNAYSMFRESVHKVEYVGKTNATDIKDENIYNFSNDNKKSSTTNNRERGRE